LHPSKTLFFSIFLSSNVLLSIRIDAKDFQQQSVGEPKQAATEVELEHAEWSFVSLMRQDYDERMCIPLICTSRVLGRASPQSPLYSFQV
jgi:hypothetical protein